ncbi:MAG: hypothetical protein H0W78_02560 [Planctomycetes bacterium]|jgi:hypothetical protein|nr:hypothetical protein [Planctomycetota bacterium]
MRNSVMPMILVMVVGLLAWGALRSDNQPGIHGPDIHPNIFRLPKKDKFHVDSAVLQSTNQVQVAGQIPANLGESWRVVLVVAKDRHALTRSTVLGLGERLTAHGCIAIFAPLDAPAFPMGVSRVITIATDETAKIPTVLGGEAQATVHVNAHLARLPQDHPAAPLLPHPEGALAADLTITHHTAAQGEVAGWANWWAALGRGLADTAITHLAPGGLPPVVDAATRKWLPTMRPLADWGAALPPPPTTERLRWDFAFQEPLVRGWIGHVTGLTSPDRSGVEKPTLDQLIERMNAGKWEAVGATGVRVFSRKQSPEALSEWFSITSTEHGWSVAWWQERSGAPALLADWATAAATGDQSAAHLLHAHRDCPVLPAELRDAARTALDGVKK